MVRRPGGDLPEVEMEAEFVALDAAGAVHAGVAGDHPRRGRSMPRRFAVAAGVGLVAALLVVGATIGSGDLPEVVEPTPTPSALARPTPVPPPTPSRPLPPPPSLVRSDSGGVARLAGADHLARPVVLAPFPHPGSGTLSTMHVIGSLGAVRRDDIPLYPADFPYPILVGAGQAVFADRATVWRVDADDVADPERSVVAALADGTSVIPHTDEGRIWVVGPDRSSVTEVDVTGDAASRQFQVGGWPVAGVADGIVAALADGYGFWTPGDRTRPMTQVPDGGVFVGSSARHIAVLYPTAAANRIGIVDPAGDILEASFVVPGRDTRRGAVGVSFSPDGQRVAVVAGRDDSTLTVLDIAIGGVVSRVRGGVSALQAPVWTSDSQLVYLAALPEDQLGLWSLDIETGEVETVADLGAPTGWWLGRAR